MKLIGAEELGKKLKQAREEITNKQAGSALYSSLMYASLPMYKYVRSQAPMTKAPYRRYMSYGQGDGFYYDKNGKKRRRRAKRGTGKYEIQESGLYHKSIKRRHCVGNALILHHPYGRQSVREIYGKGWADRTVMVVRHHSMF